MRLFFRRDRDPYAPSWHASQARSDALDILARDTENSCGPDEFSAKGEPSTRKTRAGADCPSHADATHGRRVPRGRADGHSKSGGADEYGAKAYFDKYGVPPLTAETIEQIEAEWQGVTSPKKRRRKAA